MAGGAELPGVLGELAPLLDRYGYAAIAALITLEDFGIPAPGQTVLIAGAVYAGAGRLNIVAVAAVAFAAALAGDNIGYGICRFGGRALVVRHGRYVGITERRWSRCVGRAGRSGRHPHHRHLPAGSALPALPTRRARRADRCGHRATPAPPPPQPPGRPEKR